MKKLNDYLKENNIKLTKKEIDTLECILSQGSFYEESYYPDENQQSIFIGWQIDEDECPGCRGALSSLVKKGIIQVQLDRVNFKYSQTYYSNFILEFVEDGYYHQLLLDKEVTK